MTVQRAVVAGSSGFVGTAVVEDLLRRGYEVTRVGRRGADVDWSDTAALHRVIDGADLVINFAGKSVNCRYTDSNRGEILRSRVETTALLNRVIAASDSPPRLWLNASTATIYRYSLDRPMTESGGDIGTGFSVDVAREWEQAFFSGDLPGTRRVALRMAIVLGDGEATSLLFTLARLGLAGAQLDGPWFPHRRYRGIGSAPTTSGALWHPSRGRQKFSWIHLDDVVRSIEFIERTPDLDGPVNLAAPSPSDNVTLMALLRRVTGARIGLPAFRFMLEPAMWALRTEPELLLKSRWVLPEKLDDAGFRFTWPELEPTLRDVAPRRSGRA